jgi:hypothetical protein
VVTVVNEKLVDLINRAIIETSEIEERVNRMVRYGGLALEKLQTLIEDLERIKSRLRANEDIPPEDIPTLDWLLSLEDDLGGVGDEELLRDFRESVLSVIKNEIIPMLGEKARQVFYERFEEEEEEGGEPFQQLQKKLDELLNRLRKQRRLK